MIVLDLHSVVREKSEKRKEICGQQRWRRNAWFLAVVVTPGLEASMLTVVVPCFQCP
jgi:hypothetical protein